MNRLKITAALLLAVSAAAPAQAQFNPAKCLADNSKAECRRQMLMEDSGSVPINAGDEVSGTSGKYTVKVMGDNWLKNGWAANPDQAKDLGLNKDSGVGLLNFELSDVAQADFEKTITADLQTLYTGLEVGFRRGKITISKKSEMEVLPLTISGGTGLLGRFCYQIEVKDGKTVCVYEGFMGRADGQSVKLLGSIGDYDDMRTDLESIITSFKFKD